MLEDLKKITELSSIEDKNIFYEAFFKKEDILKIFNELKDKFTDVFKTGLHLQSVKLWETPSSYALYESE